MRIYSWNVNGLRAVINKGAFKSFIDSEKPDILCIQETKAKEGQAEIDLPEYEEIWNSAKRPGYSGTAILTKIKPLSVSDVFPTELTMKDEFGDPLEEGRVQTAEFEKFYLVNVYTPNSKRSLERLGLREKKWDSEFLNYLKLLELNIQKLMFLVKVLIIILIHIVLDIQNMLVMKKCYKQQEIWVFQ